MLDLDASNLRDWFAGVGILRLLSEVSDAGRTRWDLSTGASRYQIIDPPLDFSERAARWMDERRSAWQFAGLQNVNFGPDVWREHALPATGIEVSLWCALGSDAVLHRDRKKIQASVLEYGHGGGWQHWLASMSSNIAVFDVRDLERVLDGKRDDGMACEIC